MSADAFIPPLPAEKAKGPALIPVGSIDVVARIRDVSDAGAAMMADSIEARGLLSPLLVRPVDGGRYRLVIGGHRLAGVRLLGWEDVLCDVRDLDDDEAEDLELRENLDRSDLTLLDRMAFYTRRKALDERVQARPKPGGDRQSTAAKHSANVGGMVKRFTEEMAEQVGQSERSVQRAIQIFEALDPDAIKLLRGTKHADNQQSLLKLSQHAPAKQRTLATQLRDGGAKTLAQAAVLAGFEDVTTTEDPQKTYLGQLERAWDLADPTTRATFLHSIDAAYLTVPKEVVTPEMKKALGWDNAFPIQAETPSPTPSRGGRKPAKGTH